MNIRKVKLEDVTHLEENEFLLKIFEWSNPQYTTEEYTLGFMTKLNQNGTVPKAFENWNPNYRVKVEDTFIIEEEFSSGWKVDRYRTGKSQDWMRLIHPEGFIVETYMSDFFTHLENIVIDNGELIGKFKYEAKKLIKE